MREEIVNRLLEDRGGIGQRALGNTESSNSSMDSVDWQRATEGGTYSDKYLTIAEHGQGTVPLSGDRRILYITNPCNFVPDIP